MAEVRKSTKFGDIIHLVSTIISWTIFVLLILCAIFLTYYFFATKVYMAKGSGYEPKVSLYTIVSPSMTPNIKVYDVVVDTKVDHPEDIKTGDVITFNSDNPELRGSTITHRVIAIQKDIDGKYYYQTKGDANLAEDSSLVPFSQVVGRVALKIPQLGRVQFFLASSFGWLLVVVIPALYIIIKDILKLLGITKKKPDNKQKENLIEITSSAQETSCEEKINNTTPIEVFTEDSSLDDFLSTSLPELKEDEETIKPVTESSDNIINESKEETSDFDLSMLGDDPEDEDDDLPSLK